MSIHGFVILHVESMKDLKDILSLSKKYISITQLNIQSKEIVHQPHILHLELSYKVLLAILDQTDISYQNQIIHIKDKDEKKKSTIM